MMRRYSALFITVLIHRICASTNKTPLEGRAQGLSEQPFNNGRFEHQQVIVERVNHNGKRLSPHKHFIKYEDSGVKTGTAFYRLKAFERTFQFRLERDDSFLSPSLTVEHVYSDKQRLQFSGGLRHCFYRGEVEGDPNSTAVFNLCNGMRGSFVSNGERYFVEPSIHRKMNSSTHFRKFHLVFRHSTVKQDLRDSPSFCGLADTNKDLATALDQPPRPSSKSDSRQRRKRSNGDNFVETLVVADKTMVEAFDNKADLQSYIITLMGVVSQLFRDRSIGNSINIVTVKIVLLETDEPGLSISSNASYTLKSFCEWQKRVMAKEESHPEHHDTAILLTRSNICRSSCHVLGLAPFGTMCNPSRSCSLVEDSGLETAYTIAHELGHVFNIPHDNDLSSCPRGSGVHLMAHKLDNGARLWSWSTCSRDKISQFLDNLGYGSCLADKPHEKTTIKYHDTLPGEIYSADQQCQMIFGESFSHSTPMGKPCQTLYCCCAKTIRGTAHRTHNLPWADGTPCAKNKWCIKGQCVMKRKLMRVDGNWGPWGPYKDCTRTCGGGVTFSYRECNRPIPENGGKYCIGQRKRIKSCNTQECEKGSMDFRAVQCAALGDSSYWLPKYAGVPKEDQCNLYCRSASGHYKKMKDKVIDGTPCNRDTTDICVDGKCKPTGCDRVLHSKKKFDKCGVCDGDNSSCMRVSGTYNKTKSGYHYIFTIPVDSTGIVITQYGWKNRNDSNYIALQSHRGKFLLNGNRNVKPYEEEFRFAGAKFWYSGSHSVNEQLKIDGKVTEPIRVFVFLQGSEPPNFYYSLYRKVAEPTKQVYIWERELGPWTQCSKLCQGQKKRQPRCVRAIDGQLVSNSRCDQRTRPSSLTENCNTRCLLRWNIKDQGKCTARCGTGYQIRTVRCMRYSYSSGRWDEVQGRHCAGAKPDVAISCKGTCEGTKWEYTEWTECSKSCDKGYQTRQATCVDNSGEFLIDRDCRSEEKLPERRECNPLKCPWWKKGDWSSCSVTCGSGQQTRQVKCIAEQGPVAHAKCDPIKKPNTTKSCDLEKCPYWFAGKWTECSKSCDTGFMTRKILCMFGKGLDANAVDEIHCSEHTRPAARKECKNEDCKSYLFNFDKDKTLEFYWRTTGWSECFGKCKNESVTTGAMNRNVECVKVKPGKQEIVDEQEVVHEQYCESTPKPADKGVCRVPQCTYWRHGSWGRCTKTCGKGYQIRVVKCTYWNWEIIDDEKCEPKDPPPDRRDCYIQPCEKSNTVDDTDQAPSNTQTDLLQNSIIS